MPDAFSTGGPPDHVIRYEIVLHDGTARLVEVRLDPDDLSLRAPLPDDRPDWTRLDFHQCPHCPLDPESSPHCPAAVALAPLVPLFDDFMSHDRCGVTVRTEQRTVVDPDVSVQHALGSLMGLVMAGSGCPYTAGLRPMARFHLPLASPEETIYRATSMYLLAQYFREDAGLKADWSLDGLSALYSNLQVVNRHLSRRLGSVVSTDSSVNAVISLDVFAAFLPMMIEDSLSELRPVFREWLARPAP